MKLKLPRPFLGRLLLQTVDENKAYTEWKKEKEFIKSGIDPTKTSLIIPTGESEMIIDDYGRSKMEFTAKSELRYDVRLGRIIDAAPDAFGQAFKNRYGNVGDTPKVGDYVYYIPGNAYKVSFDLSYVTIADEDVVNWYKKEEYEEKDKTKEVKENV